ncbi:hypothetical protein LS68_007650 [Helicobacter sp. MIT 05-5293]|uniref:hypothetical protein n=1 Tax=Helicobacter sp. MIT 05-5293 TaxID=1548149 RepID=UPI00051CE45E|nr:hypothetical protein [Helicobacter sp. MIT 05-5293]TLD80090.1 hypothetical protein LS68_007650 [Helicobacter sp. MIT 05-5293]
MQYFEPIPIKSCNDVGMEIRKVADFFALEEEMVSFDIVSITTLHRGEKKKDFSVLSGEELQNILGNDEQYLKDDFEVKQVYDVLIRCLKENDLAPFVALRMDNQCYELTLDLKAGLEITTDDSFFSSLYEEITRKKIVEHIIIRLFGENTQKEITYLKELFSHLGLKGKLESDQSVVIGKASQFVPEIKPHFTFVLEDQWKKSNATHVDFASYAAKGGDVVGISIKAQAGSSGRNLKGEYVNVKKQDKPEGEKVEEEIKIRFKESDFRKEDKEGVVEYYALQDGYVDFGEGELRLISDFAFPEVSLRKNGSLLGGVQKGFVIEVTCADPSQDAIGASIILEASEVKVYGSVAENATIIAKKIEINGQTHQSSHIRADEITIDIHKGTAVGDKVRVNRLELGHIEGEEVVVESASGGQIQAMDITITKLHSHSKISLSNKLYIKEMLGGENEIVISSRASLKAHEQSEYVNSQIAHNIEEINALLHVLNKDLVEVRKTKPVVEKIKGIMEENKKNNRPNDKNITDSVAQYVILLRRTKYLKERIVTLQESSKKLNASLEILDKKTQEAKIISDTQWQKDNEIVYEHFFPEGRDMMLISGGESANISIDQETLKLIRE